MFSGLHWIVSAWWLPVFLAGCIIAGAVLSFRRFTSRIGPLKLALQSATKALDECQSAKEFTRDYEEISAKIGGDAILGPTWVEFESTLLFPLQHGLVRNARRPSEYFNESLYYKGGINLRDFESVPNQLVGIGLFFTFIGLVLSLLIARQGIGADIDAAKAALGDLLNAAAFKFVTSIAALGSSVAYLSRKNKILHESDELIERFCRELERLMPQVTSEALAEESRKELMVQTAQLERFNSELAISIAEALDGKLQKSLGVAMQPIANEIGNLAERLGQINQDALTEMVGRFSTELSGAAKEHTEQMAAMLKDAATSIARVPGHIDEAGERFSEKIHLGAEELSLSLTAAAENIDVTLQGSTRGLLRSLDTAVKHGEALGVVMGANADRQEALAAKVAATEHALFDRLQSILSSTEETARHLSTLAQQVARTGEATSGMAELADRVASAAASLDAAVKKVADLSEQSVALNAQAQSVVERLTERVSAIEREMGSMNNALAAAFEKVSAGVGLFGERTTDFVQQLDRDLADAIGRLSGAVAQLDEVLGEMPKKADFLQLSRAISGTRHLQELSS